jgi:hypothetical protein
VTAAVRIRHALLGQGWLMREYRSRINNEVFDLCIFDTDAVLAYVPQRELSAFGVQAPIQRGS